MDMSGISSNAFNFVWQKTQWEAGMIIDFFAGTLSATRQRNDPRIQPKIK